jgi:hypothetical protein
VVAVKRQDITINRLLAATIEGSLKRRREYHRLGRLNGMVINIERWAGPLRWLPIDDCPHNNQPKIGVRDGGEYEGEVRLGRSARRGCLSIVLAALSSNNIIKLK